MNTSPAPDSTAPPPSARSRRSAGEGTQRERAPVLIFEEPLPMAKQVARRIAGLVEERQAVGESAVLGLPTGSTPVGVYQELARMHQEEGLDLSSVITFNLDEYYPLSPESLQSYHRFMWENFFSRVNIPEENIHIPRGDLAREEVEAHCRSYEVQIEKAGGIDLMLLGIGRSGHIGFNEPGSGPDTRTRLIILDEITRKDAASDFFGEENVPQQAITMGVGTIMDAREIILMATGEHKAPVIRRAVEEAPTEHVTASYLQEHPNVTFYVDRSAASALTRERTPWLVRTVDWTPSVAKRAVIWLSRQVDKAIPKLEAADFYRHHLHNLLHAYESADALCRKVFEDLRHRIAYREDLPASERVIVFSPHPDDDVISMGGTLEKLGRNDNEVTVAYMTNGSVAVFDADVKRHLRFVKMSMDQLGLDGQQGGDLEHTIQEHIDYVRTKAPAEVDPPAIQQFKAHIRYTEAIAAIEVAGLHAANARFLDMPFYKTGRVRKAPIGAEDVEVVLDLLKEIEPTHIYVAGDLSDPHGTHRMCYQAIKEALHRYRQHHTAAEEEPIQEGHAEETAEETAPPDSDAAADVPSEPGEAGSIPAGANGTVRTEPPPGNDGLKTGAEPHDFMHQKAAQAPPMVWLYRGAWQEWETHRADMFVPISKADLARKIEAIFKHESQKDRAMFPGAYDEREFWQRAQDRNTGTADRLNKLGLLEFYAAEAFVTTWEMP